MTDLFERRLAERLQAHPLPEEIPDLGIRSVRLGQRMRRRRIGAVVVGFVVLLMIPVASGLLGGAASTEYAPAIGRSSPPAQTSTDRITVILDLENRGLGAAPEISTVRGKSVWQPSGETVDLPAGQFGSIAEYGSRLAWLTRTGGDLRLNVSPKPLPIATNGSEVTGAEPGPSGSVMIRTKAGPVFLTRGGMLVAPSQPELRTNRMVATAKDIWVENGGRVSRVRMADIESASFNGRAYPQFQKVIIGDPRADRLLVIDDLGCQGVVKGSTAEWVWRSCDWELSAFSSDGRLVVGRSDKFGSIGIIELSTGRVARTIYPEVISVGPRLVFDDAGRLNLRVGESVVGFTFMVCGLTGECWRSTAHYPDPIEFVLPNRK